MRSDGSMYSLYTFSRKIGSTVASTGIAASLGLVGYVSGQNVTQTAEAVKATGNFCSCRKTGYAGNYSHESGSRL